MVIFDYRFVIIISNNIKGQLILEGLVGDLNASKKRTKKYYGIPDRLGFVRFLEELKTPKSSFETD